MKIIRVMFLFTSILISYVGNVFPLQPPAKGRIPVAIAVTDNANVIDLAGPLEVFQDVMIPSRGKTEAEQLAFQVYLVGESRSPVTIASGVQIVPNSTFDDAPIPKVLVVGAQMGGPKLKAWIQKVYQDHANDVVMSVCTGAFKLAGAGLLDGKPATTHHEFYDQFNTMFPQVRLLKGQRFVQSDQKIFTAGGLTSGIDLALHIVQLYFGESVAEQTAAHMEYQGTAWKTQVSSNPAH